jgi:predicted  nucleic acid-binding Zn-ribbon protein
VNDIDWEGLAEFHTKNALQMIKDRKEIEALKKDIESKQTLIVQQTQDIARLKAEIEQLKQGKT